jgi:hypothetical protein
MEEGKLMSAEAGTTQGGRLATAGSIYLHYVFDLWADRRPSAVPPVKLS